MLPYPPYHYGWIIEKCCSGYYGILHYRGTVKYTKNMENFKITIPKLTDTTVKVFVNDEYIGDATQEQVNKIRISVAEYIKETNDISILDTFYFLGHKDNNSGIMGEEIKVVMEDRYGNFSALPWEMAHTRRDMFHLMDLYRHEIHDEEAKKEQ